MVVAIYIRMPIDAGSRQNSYCSGVNTVPVLYGRYHECKVIQEATQLHEYLSQSELKHL
jgi:hypothetical protein